MSLAAMLYIKRLRKAPNGKRISATEKCVLQILADDHREEVGFAFTGMRTIAEAAGLSLRQCRRVVADLESYGMIKRHVSVRTNDGGQSSNEYTFPEIDGVVSQNTPEQVAKRKKVLRTPRTRMTGGSVKAYGKVVEKTSTPRSSTTGAPGHRRPTPPVMGDLPSRSRTTVPPGHRRPPIEPSMEPTKEPAVEHAEEPNTTPTPPREEGRIKPAFGKQANTLEALKAILPKEAARRISQPEADEIPQATARIVAGRTFLDELHDEFARQYGMSAAVKNSRGPEWESPIQAWNRCFEHVRVASVEAAEGKDSELLVVLETPRPRDLQDGLTKYKAKVSIAMKKAFGREVQLVPRLEAA